MIGLTNTWKEEDKKSLIQLKKEGVAFFANRKYVGKMHQHDLMGLKWLDKDFVRSTLAAMDNGEIVAKLLVRDAKVKITPVQRNGKIAFEVEGKYEGDIFRFYRDASLEEIKKYAEKELIYTLLNRPTAEPHGRCCRIAPPRVGGQRASSVEPRAVMFAPTRSPSASKRRHVRGWPQRQSRGPKT